MRRRELLVAFGVAAAWSMTAQAQQSSKIPRLGYLTGDSESADLPRRKAFVQGLHVLGYDQGETILIDFHTAAGSMDALIQAAGELSKLNADVVFAFSVAAVQVVAKAMPRTPIVSITPDPVLAGLASSLARPGGNVSGLSTWAGPEIYSKDLELLKDVVPGLTRVAALCNPRNSVSALATNAMNAAAPALGLSLQILEALDPTQVEGAIAAAVMQQAGGLVVVQDTMLLAQRSQLADLAARKRLPAVYGIREHADAGGLMAYAASRPEMFRRAAYYVDRILKGASPADLPIEQPTKFELIINLKAAKLLNLAIPPTLIARADEVIE